MSSASISLFTKYNLTPACTPWATAVGVRFALGPMADIDGDGFQEVMTMVPDPTGLTAPRLGVLSYMDLALIAPEWKNAPGQIQIIASSNMSLSTLPAATAPVGFSLAGNVTGAAQADMIVFDGTNLAVWQWNAVTGMQSVFISSNGVLQGVGATKSFHLKQLKADSCVTADIDGDGIDEIVLANGGHLAVAKYNSASSSLECIWVSSSPMDALNIQQLFVCNFGQANSILANAGNHGLKLFNWSDGELNRTWQSAIIQSDSSAIPALNLTWPGPQPQFLIGDFNSDGVDEVLAFASLPQGSSVSEVALWMMVWSGTTLIVQACETALLIGGGARTWLPGNAGSSQVAVIPGSTSAVLLTIDTSTSFLTIINWSSAEGFSVWIDQNQIDGMSGSANVWTIAADNLLTIADINGDGVNELIVQSDSAGGFAVLAYDPTIYTWQAFWASTTPVNIPQSVLPSLSSWGMGLLNSTPAVAYPTFTPAQQTVYTQIGPSLNPAIPASQTLGVRGEYTNSDDIDTFGTWAVLLEDQVSYIANGDQSSLWPWINSDNEDDCTTVFNELIIELNQLSPVWNCFQGNKTGMSQFLNMLSGQRSADLLTVKTNLVTLPPSAQTSPYWPGQFYVAAMVALSAIPFGPELQIPAAILASLSASFLAQANADSPAPLEPTLVQFSDLTNLIENEYLAAATVISTMCNNFVTDGVKMRILTPLLQGPWAPLASTDYTEVIGSSSAYNRLQFYQMLMPTLFQAEQWLYTTQSAPWYVDNLTISWNGEERSLDLPDMAQATSTTGSGPYNLSMPVNIGTPMPNPSLPSQLLLNDLLTNMGLPLAQILGGQGGWQLPVSTYSIGDPCNSGQVWVTNATDQPLWVTVYSVWDPLFIKKTKIESAGTVPPGTTMGMSSNWRNPQEGDEYDGAIIRGQLNGVEGGSFDVSISTNPAFNSGGSTATTQTWTIYSATGSAGSWAIGPV